jgi:GTP-dependent phosphoenolpyruvate carboxykinase
MVDNIVSIPENDDESALTIYPNPNNGTFNILAGTDVKDASISIYNILGEKVYSENTDLTAGQAWKANLDNYPKGMYIIAIESSEMKRSEKLMIR